MFRDKKHILKYLKSAAVIVIISAILFSVSAYKKLAPIQSGILEDDDELDIGGEITFTISNESGTRSEAAAPIAFANAFMKKYPNVTVHVDEDNRGNYPTRISSGEIGDVFWCDGNDARNYKENHNALMMLDYYRDRLGIDIDNVFSGALMSGMIDGRLYMVPRNIGQQILIYNSDALRQANISIPSGGEAIKWDDFKDICRQLTLEENGTYTQVGASFKVWWSPVWAAFAEGWGGTWIDTESKKISFVSDDKVMNGINELVNALTEGWMKADVTPYSGAAADKYKGLSDLDYVFRTFGDLQWITAYGEAYDNANIAWDFCSFPEFPTHKVVAGATGYVVYARTRNADTAATFALYFLSEDGQRAYHGTSGGNVPLLKSIAGESFWRMPDSKWSDKNFEAFVSYPDATFSRSMPSEISAILSNEAMTTAFASIINGSRDVQTVFAELETKCNETWAKLYK